MIMLEILDTTYFLILILASDICPDHPRAPGAEEKLGPGRAAAWPSGRGGQAGGQGEGAQDGVGGQVDHCDT